MSDAETVRARIVCPEYLADPDFHADEQEGGGAECEYCNGTRSIEATLAEPDASLLRLGRAVLHGVTHGLTVADCYPNGVSTEQRLHARVEYQSALSAALAAQPGEPKSKLAALGVASEEKTG